MTHQNCKWDTVRRACGTGVWIPFVYLSHLLWWRERVQQQLDFVSGRRGEYRAENTVDVQIYFIHVLTLTYRLDICTRRDNKAATNDHFILTADQMALCVCVYCGDEHTWNYSIIWQSTLAICMEHFSDSEVMVMVFTLRYQGAQSK